MRTIFAEYNPQCNSIDVYTSAGYMLRIDCWEAEKDLKTTPGSDCVLNELAINEPLEYTRLYLDEFPPSGSVIVSLYVPVVSNKVTASSAPEIQNTFAVPSVTSSAQSIDRSLPASRFMEVPPNKYSVSEKSS